MSLNLDLETWSRVTAHHLPKGTLGVKYKPDLDKGRLIMLRQVKLNRQTNHRECPHWHRACRALINLLVQLTCLLKIFPREIHMEMQLINK